MEPTVADVMTRDVVTVDALAPFKEVVRRMLEHRVSALPVLDADGILVGVVSEADLILKQDRGLEGGGRLFAGPHRVADRAKAAGLRAHELMSTPVISIGPDAPLCEAARRMHRGGVKRLPVVDEEGRLVGIVSRADLLRVYLRADADILREVREDVIRRTLWIDPATIRIDVHDGVVTLEGSVERESMLPVLERLVASVPGVVAVNDRLSCTEVDPGPPLPAGPWTAIVPGTSRR
jgi:CBS-domain-containing membrane protein